MKYYSYIDHLNLNIDELVSLSPYKLKELINEINNLNLDQKTVLISGLKDSATLSYHITIEKNTWLKDILYKNFNQLKPSNIILNLEHIDYISGFKYYLELYLRPILPDLIEYLIDENELKLLYQILSQADLFSNNCENDIIRIFKNKIDNAIVQLRAPNLNLSDLRIDYIRNYHFYEILNLYESHFKDKLILLYDEITERVNQFATNSNDPNYRFISQAQVAFKKSEIDDVATKLLIDNNADNAKDFAYKYTTETKPSASKPNSRRLNDFISISGIIVFVFIISIVAFNSMRETKDEQKPQRTVNIDTKKKRTTYDNRIRFYYSLKRITEKSKSEIYLDDEHILRPFSNPYPKTFDLIQNNTETSKNFNFEINNETGSHLIIFKMVKGKDQSLYIPQDKSVYISLNKTDSLLFYSGKDFSISKFSQFREDMLISDIYKVKEIDTTQLSKLSIASLDQSTNSENRLISEEDFTTNNIELKKMSIDNLYRIYYRKYSN